MSEHLHQHVTDLEFGSLLWLTGILMAGICGFVGNFVVMRRLSFLADTIAHGSLAGVGLGVLLGLPSTPMVILYSVLLSLLLTWASRYQRDSISSLTAVAFAVSVGTGILLLGDSGGQDAHELVHVLFGDLRHITTSDMWLLLLLGLPALIFLWGWRRPLTLSFIHEDLARASGIPVQRYDYLFMICVALTIALCLKLCGVLLVMTLVTLPALIASRIAQQLSVQFWLSPLIAVVCTGAGLHFATRFHAPSGALIALICGTGYLLVRLVRRGVV